jgi:proteasome lid subunit RPN8/RPN11
MKLKGDLKVRIDAEALARIWKWTDLARGEFSCLALVHDDLSVDGVQLFDQTCTSSSTDIDQAALAKFLCTHHQPERVRAWVHSHAHLGIFWSQQDEQCIDGLANESLLVSIVVNKKREVKCRIDIFQPVRVTIDDVPVVVELPAYDIHDECEALFKRHVSEVSLMLPGKRLHAPQPTWPGFDDDYSGWEGM